MRTPKTSGEMICPVTPLRLFDDGILGIGDTGHFERWAH
jgi:hypothetical protein